jgi:hypothetical protein
LQGCAFETRSETCDAISDYIETITTRNGGILLMATHPRQLRAGAFRPARGMIHIDNLSGKSGEAPGFTTLQAAGRPRVAETSEAIYKPAKGFRTGNGHHLAI